MVMQNKALLCALYLVLIYFSTNKQPYANKQLGNSENWTLNYSVTKNKL